MKPNHFFMFAMFGVVSTIFTQHASVAAERIKAPEAVVMSNLIYVVDPQYPRDVKIDGKVILNIVIDTEGNVIEAHLLDGHPMLVDATLDAVKRWKFRPYLLNNQPVEVETTATVEYRADPPSVVTPKPYMRVSMGVMQGLLIHHVDPDYPIEARAGHIQGDVILHARISREGNVVDLKYVSGHPTLVKAAIDAAKQWQYKPYLLNGEPAEVVTTIAVQFRLSE
jgi:TonB family protein